MLLEKASISGALFARWKRVEASSGREGAIRIRRQKKKKARRGRLLDKTKQEEKKEKVQVQVLLAVFLLEILTKTV